MPVGLESLKEDYRRFYGANVGMAGRGMAIARESNYCEIDPNVVDKFGIPVLRSTINGAMQKSTRQTHAGYI